jgi:transposase
MAELRAGKSQRQVAANFNTNQPTISKIKKRWETYQNLRSRQLKGRLKELTALQILRINSYINRHRNLTWNDVLIELELKRLNSHTTQRRLHSHWRLKWRAKRRIKLAEEDAQETLTHRGFLAPSS